MLNEQTMEKMNEMKLPAMAEAFEQQLSSGEHAKLSFEERIGLMVESLGHGREFHLVHLLHRLFVQHGLSSSAAA